ncbi:MAG: hypothetical protein JW912_08505 [Sedimentisphaerales bacterium]|nr:hypothetical protein [Sedimentisphaerales bacterium]
MSISFTCECCEKKIKAPDNAGGRWGSCPHCNHRCYIPLPHDDDEEELKLAPIDANEESQYHEMMKETHDLTQNILKQNEVPDDDGDPGPYNEKELLKNIIVYLRHMTAGNLDQAEAAVGKIAAFKEQAGDILRRMAKAERPEPELQDVPPKLLHGFMKSLLSKLK